MKCEKAFSHHLYDNEENSYYTIQVFKILTCLTCDSVTVLLYSAGGIEEEDEQNPNEPQFRCYGRSVLYAPARQLHDSIPLSISEVVKQAEAVLARSPRASFILCRAVLEEICNDFKIPTESTNNKGKSYFIKLHDRLSQLFKQEKMPEELQTIINGIKDLGNEGAHSDHLAFAKQVKAQDAENLLTLVNYVLERLYFDRYRQQEAAETLKELKSKIPLSEQ
ncbi:MAG: DUF4145 domain-containing protein [Microcoleus sp. PH2017_07_MST_O_A]|nr:MULTISPECIES: DUF4145 domain-containing protein [unclassified Microcoleus]MCC3419619.1 DUF4145 domain-containing protein [Microcoleus sp. PH2017_07_MST_O_A]MCC3472900.1 DUF4145 domain-containing protein [Microcoleus sp. PH2017_13_LAR_U_A]MCC3622949.1 DUF4145 domain-containing protein [Microcoleus sp. PH2017_36_ELK_O_B]MCC3457823.1 DUF4145 domain-containing protein [Microcoleus sp. PH2017_08_TRC_O_A]MCC3485247.1 DUF4145 domain-containing protein [Microcoleus sp. PH2017_14_LAR_D_A]